MTKQRLSDAVKAYYDSQSLDDNTLDHYQQLQRTEAEPNQVQHARRYSMAAIMSVLLVAMISWQFYPIQNDMGLEIAQEVAKNHIKMKPLEVKSDQIDDLRQYFTQLDFALIEPNALSHHTLKGARYCSIQGVTAAQFRYHGQDTANGITVYEVDYQPDIFGDIPDIERGESPREIQLKGLLLKLWVEKGLLLVSAQEQVRK